MGKLGKIKKALEVAKRARKFLKSSQGNDVVKQPWRYRIDKLEEGSLNAKSIDKELTRLSKEAAKRSGALKRSKFKDLDVIKQIDDWLKYTPKNDDEKKAKLSILARFAGDDRLSTAGGLRKEIGMYQQIYADVVSDKLSNSAIGYSFYKLFMRETGNKNLNKFENSAAIAQAIMDWRFSRV